MVKRHNARRTFFRDNLSPVRISVHRLDIAPDKTLGKNWPSSGERSRRETRISRLGQNDRCGAERDERRKVSPSPLQNNMWHADIVLPDEVKEDRAGTRTARRRICRKSSWHRVRIIKTRSPPCLGRGESVNPSAKKMRFISAIIPNSFFPPKTKRARMLTLLAESPGESGGSKLTDGGNSGIFPACIN